jgi:hypothetical protein
VKLIEKGVKGESVERGVKAKSIAEGGEREINRESRG